MTSSPAYVLDEEKLRNNLALIQSIQSRSGAEFLLSLKGFAWWPLFSIITEYISSGSASSLNEIQLLHDGTFQNIHSYIPAIVESDVESVLRKSAKVSANSWNQFNLIKKRNKNFNRSLGIRVNLGYSETSTELYNPASPFSRFGISAEQLNEWDDEVEGIHFHSMCEAGLDEIERTLQVFEDKFVSVLTKVKWVNLGGGHLVTKKGFNVDRYVELLSVLKTKYDLEIYVEPSSAFLWECGDLHSTIVDIVNKGGVKTAMLNVSFTAHMPDCLEMPYQPQIEGAEIVEQVDEYTYKMGGNTCLAGDCMGNWRFKTPLSVGDQIIFKDMIHYTTVKTTMFNGVQHPDLILSRNGNFETLRKFNFSDYKRRMC